MKLLLDTHTLIWLLYDNAQLSPAALNALQSGENTIYVSAVTACEIAIKVRLGKLAFDPVQVRDFEGLVARMGFEPLAIRVAHGARAGLLSGAHRDPFDRMLAAQSEIENLSLVTKDPAFASLGVKTLW